MEKPASLEEGEEEKLKIQVVMMANSVLLSGLILGFFT